MAWNAVWRALPIGRLRAAIQEKWEPSIDDRGTRDEAFAAMVAAAVVQTPK